MARDNEDIYLKNTLDGFCGKLNAGIVCEDAMSEVKRVSIIRGINAYVEGYGDNPTVCEDGALVEAPSIICLDGTQEIDPEYEFIVTNPIAIDGILYGWYDLNPDTQPNPITPNATDVANDIATNPGNYTLDTWSDGLTAQIVNGQISYHVVRLPISLGSITLTDEGGVNVTAAWDVLTDGTYNYYVLMTPVAINADVTYILND